MSIRELYLTNSVVKRMLGLHPILKGVPEIKQALDSSPSTIIAKRRGCGKCGRKGHSIPVSAAKILAPIIGDLSEAKKQIILQTLGADLLKGFVGSSSKAVNLAQKTA